MRELLGGNRLDVGSTAAHGLRKIFSGSCCGAHFNHGEIQTFLETFSEDSWMDFDSVWTQEDGLPLCHGLGDACFEACWMQSLILIRDWIDME